MGGRLSGPDEPVGTQRSLEGIHWPYLNLPLVFATLAALARVAWLSSVA